MEIASLAAAGVPDPMREARAAKAAQDFEAMVIAELLAPIFASVDAPAVAGGGGAGEKAFSSLLVEEYGRAIAARGGFGVADQVKAALIDLQSARPQAAAATGEAR